MRYIRIEARFAGRHRKLFNDDDDLAMRGGNC